MHEDLYEQKNSGMLGVHGNIGFSTAFHGFHMEVGCKPGSGCCVGDDGAGGFKEDPNERFVPHLQIAGTISVKKATLLPPLLESDTEQIAKFVKRRFTRNHDGITIGFLLAFPSFASAFGISDEYHNSTDDDEATQIMKFIGQVGSFFWDIFHKGYLEPEEYRLVRMTLGIVYKKFRLPQRGSLPGYHHDAFSDGLLLLAVPSLETDYALEDWAEHLWSTTSQQWALLPMQLGNPLPPPYETGRYFETRSGAFINALEDVGCIKKVRMMTEWVEVNETNRRLFRLSFDTGNRSYLCQYLDHYPIWFDSYLSNQYRSPLVFWN